MNLTGEATSPQLDYAPGPGRLGRRSARRIIVIAVAVTLASVAYWQRARLLLWRDQTKLAWIQWRCLHAGGEADDIAYEEDPGADALLKRSEYTRLPQGAAGRKSQQWYDLTSALGRRTFLWPQRLRGGVVFLHERYTPAGKRVLVYAVYGPTNDGSAGTLQIFLLSADSIWTPMDFNGGLGVDDFSVLQSSKPFTVINHPAEHKVRIYAGQSDPSDRTKFHFDYELDGKRARTEVRLRDPDPTSTVPDWYQVEVGHGWK